MKWAYKGLICLSLFSINFLYALNTSALKKRISSKKHPEWMEQAVSQALSDLSDAKVDSKSIDRMYHALQVKKKCVVRFQVRDKTLRSTREFYDFTGRYSTVHKAMNILHKEIGLPELDILVCIGDSFEEEWGIPVFAFAKDKKAKHTVLIPDIEALRGYNETRNIISGAIPKHPWHQKVEKGYFRGTTTGGFFDRTNWDKYPRTKAALLSLEVPDYLDAKITKLTQGAEKLSGVFKQNNVFGNRVAVGDHLHYKYLLDIDGNSCTYPRCFWILYSNSVLFKVASQNIQWFYEAIKPYVHYVPIQADLSDLVDQVIWARYHDLEAKKIAENATEFAREQLSPESVYEYLYLLLTKFAKLQKKS